MLASHNRTSLYWWHFQISRLESDVEEEEEEKLDHFFEPIPFDTPASKIKQKALAESSNLQTLNLSPIASFEQAWEWG